MSKRFAIIDPREKGISPRLGFQGRHASPKRGIDNLPHVPHLVPNQGIRPREETQFRDNDDEQVPKLLKVLVCFFGNLEVGWLCAREDNSLERGSLEDIITRIILN